MPAPPRTARRRWRLLVLALLPVLALAALPGVGLRFAAGETAVPIRFRVTDSATGRPLPGAFLRLFLGNQVARDVQTGPGGEAETVIACPVAVRCGLLSRRESVEIPGWCFFVSSLGHKPAGPFYLRDYVGVRRDDPAAPPVIEVRLEKQDPFPTPK
jgi:hypothetical protein